VERITALSSAARARSCSCSAAKRIRQSSPKWGPFLGRLPRSVMRRLVPRQLIQVRGVVLYDYFKSLVLFVKESGPDWGPGVLLP
jgi:hypothetical protein